MLLYGVLCNPTLNVLVHLNKQEELYYTSRLWGTELLTIGASPFQLGYI
jgi:hypothetical protein